MAMTSISTQQPFRTSFETSNHVPAGLLSAKYLLRISETAGTSLRLVRNTWFLPHGKKLDDLIPSGLQMRGAISPHASQLLNQIFHDPGFAFFLQCIGGGTVLPDREAYGLSYICS
jgi:hypothetical protein